MTLIAAWLAGFCGLLFELVAVRRLGLLFGNTAESATLVLGVFVLGLGVGGFAVAQVPALARRARPGAALAYALAAVGLAAGAVWLERADHAAADPIATGALLVGVPALCMGVAFPLLFACVAARRVGVLVGVNLLGSALACFVGGNFAIPDLGLATSHWLAAAGYALAAVLVSRSGRPAPDRVTEHPEPDAVPAIDGAPSVSRLSGVALLAGAVVIGLEVLWLRRLPYFLDGFQPTLSGVLSACLVWLTLGAALASPLLGRLRGGGIAHALGVAALGTALGLHEHVAPLTGRIAVTGDAGFHARILMTAAAAAALPCLAYGAIVPLCVRVRGGTAGDRAALAGRLQLWQGVGAALGALLLGHALPALAPDRYFAVAPLLLGALAVLAAALVARRSRATWLGVVVLAASFGGVSGAGSPLDPAPPVRGSRYDRPASHVHLAQRTDSVGTAAVVYDRANHAMTLFTNEFRAAYTGPGTSYMKVLGHLPLLLRPGPRSVAVIALGTGTTADAVCAWDEPERVHVVEISPAVLALAPHFAADGPVTTGEPPRWRRDRRTIAHVADGRRWLSVQPDASLDLVTMEPLLPYAPGTAALYSREFYELVAARLAGGGLCVQWVPTHALPEPSFRTLLATFADAFTHCSVWLVDQATLLVGSRTPHLPDAAELERRLAEAPALVQTTLHEAGIAAAVDLAAAFVTAAPLAELWGARRLVDDRPFLERVGYWSGAERLSFHGRNLGVLAAMATVVADDPWPGQRALRGARLAGLAARADAVLDASGERLAVAVGMAATARGAAPDSVLLHREETLALRALAEREVLLARSPRALRLRDAQLERDPGSALLVAAAGGVGAARAIAIDPTVYDSAPDYLRAAAPPRPHRSPFEDLGTLPDGERLAELASLDNDRGAALRAAFGVRCARALVGLAARRAPTRAELAALRPLLDPASWRSLGQAVTSRGGDVVGELLPLWRRDLGANRTIAALASGDEPARAALAAALAGRRGGAELGLLADLLDDEARGVRLAASAALVASVGDRVPYDPEWPSQRRRAAAQALRALHNP